VTEKTLDILSFGEPLMEFAEVERDGEKLYLPGFGGDSSNAAIAAARQGARVAYFTALGDDAFGQGFLDLWDREGVERASVATRPGGRTGLYFISYGPQGHVFSYFRAGSAASLVAPADLPLERIAQARVLHLSGISQAISETCTDAGFSAMRHARANGTAVSYDTNLRIRYGRSTGRARSSTPRRRWPTSPGRRSTMRASSPGSTTRTRSAASISASAAGLLP
jgi:2-dehydro-3-deoxygluconokinase